MTDRKNTLIKVLFVIYMLVLSWVILLKLTLPQDLVHLSHIRNINLIPLQGIGSNIVNNQMFGNIELFIPFGLYIAILAKRTAFWKKCLIFAGVSFIYEMLQYVFAIGVSDITDIIMNVLGGMVGLGIYWVISKLCRSVRRTDKFLTVCAVVGTILIMLLIIIVLAVNY